MSEAERPHRLAPQLPVGSHSGLGILAPLDGPARRPGAFGRRLEFPADLEHGLEDPGFADPVPLQSGQACPRLA